MATIWGGVHTRLGTPVAFKFLSPDADRVRGALRFMDETRALARMNHPHIVRVYDAGICHPALADYLGNIEVDSPYFVMEAVSGGTLKEMQIRGWDDVKRCTAALLDAVAHAHARDVIHRDIKPANVLIDASGAPRLTDFGISRLASRSGVTDRVTGTPSYMSPEQIAGDSGREGPWTDLYALGCVVFWLVTGNAPFQGSVEEVLRGHVHEPPPPFAPRFAVPDGLEEWVLTLLEKDPQARFGRAADAAWRLGQLGSSALATDEFEHAFEDHGVTLTSVFTGEFGSLGDLESGSSTVFATPTPPEDWRSSDVATRHQLISSGPGMLPYREPELRGRESERDILWEELRRTFDEQQDRVVRIAGPSGVGRTALAKWFCRRSHELGSAHLLVFEGDTQRSIRDQLGRWWDQVGGDRGATAFYAARGEFNELAEWDLDQIKRLASGAELAGPILSAVHGRWTARLSIDRTVVYYAENDEVVGLVRASAATAPGRRLLVTITDNEVSEDRTIHLRPLPDRVVTDILRSLIGMTESSSKALARACEGNIAAAVDIARTAVRAGELWPTDKGFHLDDDAIASLLGGRRNRWVGSIQHLPERYRRLLALVAHADTMCRGEELDVVCDSEEVDSALFIQAVSEAQLMFGTSSALHFTHPLARRAARDAHDLEPHDFAIVHAAFTGPPDTPRRRAVRALSAYLAQTVSAQDVLLEARALRTDNQTESAIELLLEVRPSLSGSLRTTCDVELAECYLSRQLYADAADALGAIPPERLTADARALQLFLAMRRLEDVQDELLAIDRSVLSETAARMVSYVQMDLGDFDGALQTLEAMDATYDPPGRLFAFARLEFLRQNWRQAEQWGLEATRRFEEIGRPDGAIAARDIVASARLKQGRAEEAVALYRANLRAARHVAAPSFVQSYNLAICLLETGEQGDEIDVRLEGVVAETIQRDRKDIEHAARSAQLLYALRIEDYPLAEHRLENLRGTELGPWLQSDSYDHLEAASELAPMHLRPMLESLLETVSAALKAKSS